MRRAFVDEPPIQVVEEGRGGAGLLPGGSLVVEERLLQEARLVAVLVHAVLGVRELDHRLSCLRSELERALERSLPLWPCVDVLRLARDFGCGFSPCAQAGVGGRESQPPRKKRRPRNACTPRAARMPLAERQRPLVHMVGIHAYIPP